MNKRPPRNGEIVEKKQNTLLVDGNALFKTGFFGAKTLFNSKGEHIGGIYQFFTVLRKILSEDLYHRVYVFWDGNFSGKLRYDIYEPYKSGRGKDFKNGTQPIDVSELKQRIRIRQYLNELFVRQMMDDVIEGDDLIAYYCLNKKKNEKITIITNDRDFCQLIDTDVQIYFCDKRIKNYVGLSNFSSYFCYNQNNSLLIKTMTGDDSDTIKGIKGVKEPSLVKQFPIIKDKEVSLNEIIEEAKKQQEERIIKKLKPLKILENIINKVTVGVQGDKIYEINDKLIDLKKPMMTEDGIRELKLLMDGRINPDDKDVQKVFNWMEEDGLKSEMGDFRFGEFLLPFKKLVERENQDY